MSNMPFASKSPKGKGSNGHKPTGAMTGTYPQTKPQTGVGLSGGNHPTTHMNDHPGSVRTQTHPAIKNARGE